MIGYASHFENCKKDEMKMSLLLFLFTNSVRARSQVQAEAACCLGRPAGINIDSQFGFEKL